MFPPDTKVLVIDDMGTMRKLVSKICRDLGFSDITEANDGKEAWELLSKTHPAFGVVICDWNMPNCSGLELLKLVRADARMSKLPFLMVTAEAEQSQVMEAIQAGVSNYVVKPFTSDTLRSKLDIMHQRVQRSTATK